MYKTSLSLNFVQVWNLKSRSVACDLQWESNITAFSVINGSSFMYEIDVHPRKLYSRNS